MNYYNNTLSKEDARSYVRKQIIADNTRQRNLAFLWEGNICGKWGIYYYWGIKDNQERLASREQRAKWYASHTITPHPVISAPLYVRLIKSPRLIGVHPYIRMRTIIKFTGTINLAAVVRVIARYSSRNKVSSIAGVEFNALRKLIQNGDRLRDTRDNLSRLSFILSEHLLRNVYTQMRGFMQRLARFWHRL